MQIFIEVFGWIIAWSLITFCLLMANMQRQKALSRKFKDKK